jgi:transglutaminase-like putative cysteine protease
VKASRLEALRHENSARAGRSTDTQPLGWALREETLIPLSDDARRMALEAVGDRTGTDERARALYDNTLERMDYDKSGTGWGRGDFRYACDVGKGNCTDFHSYFIGLCRNIGIPAYFEIGLSVPGDPDSGQTGTYHCWAYYWNGGAWIPVDISEADRHPEKRDYFFGNLDEDRLAFTVGRDIVLSPPQEGPPLNYFILPYAEVDGRVHRAVSKKTMYRPA